MCTVTLAPLPGETLWRLAVNRDERRDRPAARPPEMRTFGRRRAAMPIDPESDGTWVAVNDAGLAMTLLNVNPDPTSPHDRAANRRTDERQSRGGVIPALLQHDTLEDALRDAEAIAPARVRPFRLLIVDERRIASVLNDGLSLHVHRRTIDDRVAMFCSSGLGDELVRPPRQKLLHEMFDTASPADWCDVQDAYHRHRWPDRPELSVCMSRDDARTVSLTVIERGPDHARLDYHPGPPNAAPPRTPVGLTLPRARH